MRRSSNYLIAALVFVAIWVVVAGAAALLSGPAPVDRAAAPAPLPTGEIIEIVGQGESGGTEVVSWLGEGEAASAPQTAPAPEPAKRAEGPATSVEGDDPETRGLDAAPPPKAESPPKSRAFDEMAETTAAADAEFDEPRPIDRAKLEGVIERLKQSDQNGILKPEIPAQMTAFETKRVKIVLARRDEAVEIVSEPGADLTSASEVPVRDFVKVELYGGSDFRVEPVIDDQGPQSIRRRDRGEWEFDVTPLSGGAHDLEIIVLLYDAPAFLPIAKFSQKITVEVPFGSRIKLIWSGIGGDWLLNFLIAPFVAAVAAAAVAMRIERSRAKGRKAAEPADSGPPGVHPG